MSVRQLVTLGAGILLLFASTASGPASACSIVPPARLEGETDEQYRLRLEDRWERQRVEIEDRIAAKQKLLVESSEVIIVARVSKIGGNYKKKVTLQRIGYLVGEGGKKRYTVRGYVSSCGPSVGDDATFAELGDLLIVFLKDSKDNSERVENIYLLRNVYDPRLLELLRGANFLSAKELVG